MNDGPSPERTLRKALQVLCRLGGFGIVFVALLIGIARITGPSENLLIQGTVGCLAALAATAILLRLDGRRPLSHVGLHRSGAAASLARSFGFGVAIVVPAVAVAMAGGLRYGPDTGTVIQYLATGAWTALVLFPAAAAEEFLFRGYPLSVVAERWGLAASLVLTTAAFSVLHGWNPNMDVLTLVNIAMAGALLWAVRIVTGSLWHAIGVHLGWNFATGFLADLPVSGMSLVDAPLVEVTSSGRDLWTGGAAGLEGGLGSTLAVSLALAHVVRGHRTGRWKASGQDGSTAQAAVQAGQGGRTARAAVQAGQGEGGP